MKKRKYLRNIELITIVIAILLGIVGVFSFGFLEDINQQGNTKNAEDKPPVTETLTINSSKVKNLYNLLINVRLCDEGTTWDYDELANGTALTFTKLTTSDKVDLVFRKLDIDGLIPKESYDQTKGEYNTVTITKEQFDSAAESIFNQTITLDNTAIKNIIVRGFKFSYDATTTTITGEGVGIGCERPGLESKLIGVNTITNGLELIVQVNTPIIDPQDVLAENTKQEFYVYKYTFTKQGNNYYLSNISYNID